MAPHKLSRGHADPRELDHGSAAGAGSRRGPNPRQCEVAFRRSLHARTNESGDQLYKGCRHWGGHAGRRSRRSRSFQSPRVEGRRHRRIHEFRLAGMDGVDARRGRPAGVNKIDPGLAPIETSLSWRGMPGLTAYFGLLELGRPRPGDTVVVSAASGAVGQLVGQIAKLAGCRAVAIAGSDDKLKWCREIGFDAAINYKKAADITAAVKEACPRGVDIFFDNTAGPIHDAVMKNLSIGARVVICGRVALASQFGKPDIGERFMGHLIVTRASIHGFLVFDWWHRRSDALQRLSSWQRTGHIRFKEDVLEGIERMPEAFLRLLHGENFGKQIIKIG